MLNAPRDSVLHGRIDADDIGVAGYSQGGAGAIRAVTGYGNSGAFDAIFTGSAAYRRTGAKNSGCGYDTAKVAIPYFMTAGTGTSEDSGPEGHFERVRRCRATVFAGGQLQPGARRRS